MRAGHAPWAFGFIMSSVPITAPAYLSPFAPSKLPRRAVGVSLLKAPRVSAFVEAAIMIAVVILRTIVWCSESNGISLLPCELAAQAWLCF